VISHSLLLTESTTSPTLFAALSNMDDILPLVLRLLAVDLVVAMT